MSTETKVVSPEFKAWHFASLKGHTESINDMEVTAKGEMLISVADDKSIRLWHLNDPVASRYTHVDLDTPNRLTACACNPDGSLFAVSLSNDEGVASVLVYKLTEGKGPHHTHTHTVEKLHEFKTRHNGSIVSLTWGSHIVNGEEEDFLMTCGAKDTLIEAYSLTGVEIFSQNTHQVSHHDVAVSLDGNWVALASQQQGVRVYKSNYSQQGHLVDLQKVTALTGHAKGVNSLHFDKPSQRLVVAGGDGSWKRWLTEVKYKAQETASLELDVKTDFESLDHIAVSSSGETIAVTNGSTLQIWSSPASHHYHHSGHHRHPGHDVAPPKPELLVSIENAHEEAITGLVALDQGFFATAAGDHIINIWRAALPKPQSEQAQSG